MIERIIGALVIAGSLWAIQTETKLKQSFTISPKSIKSIDLKRPTNLYLSTMWQHCKGR